MQRSRLSRTQTQKAWRGNQDLGEPRGAAAGSKAVRPIPAGQLRFCIPESPQTVTRCHWTLGFMRRDCVCLHSCTSHAVWRTVGITCLWNNSVSYVYIMPPVCKALLYTYLSSHLR